MRRLLLLALAAAAAFAAFRSARIHLGARAAVRIAAAEGSSPRLPEEIRAALAADPAGGSELPKLAARLAAAGFRAEALEVAESAGRATGSSDLLFLEASIHLDSAASDPREADAARAGFERLRRLAPDDVAVAQNLLRIGVATRDSALLRRIALEELRRRPRAFDPLVALGNAELRRDLLVAARAYRLALASTDPALRASPPVFREDETARVAAGMFGVTGRPGEPSWGAAAGGRP